MSPREPTLNRLTEILCNRANYERTNSLQNGLVAVIKALIDEAPSKEELEDIYYKYGLEGVRDYILGSDRLLPNPPVNMPPAYWELDKKYKELRVKHEDLQKQYEALADTNSKDLEELRRLQKEQAAPSSLNNILASCQHAVGATSVSLNIIRTKLEEMYKAATKDTNKPSS